MIFKVVKYRCVKRQVSVEIGRRVAKWDRAVIDRGVETRDGVRIDKVLKIRDGAGKD